MSTTNDTTNTNPTATASIRNAAPTHSAVIYLRVSSSGQITGADSDGLSIKAQREACLKQACSMGATVVVEYVDKAESARSSKRPRLQAMLTDLKTNRCRVCLRMLRISIS